MHRIIRFSIMSLSLLLTVATLAIWATSYWRGWMISCGDHRIVLIAEGRLSFLRGDLLDRLGFGFVYEPPITGVPGAPPNEYPLLATEPLDQWTMRLVSVVLAADSRTPRSYLGFGCNFFYPFFVFFLPLWFLALLLSTPAFLLRPRRRPKPGHCPECGYDLRASPIRCPECGTPVPVKSEELL